MSFNLEVQFTGLCLHVQHKTKSAVAVLMPDGRFKGSTQLHPDNTEAAPHVGYIRLDLANVATSTGATLPAGERPGRFSASDGPFFETIYRIGSLGKPLGGGQTLDFGIKPDRKQLTPKIRLPDLKSVAPRLPLRAGLFTKRAGAVPAKSIASPLLFRTVLYGGKLKSTPGTLAEDWCIERRLTQAPGKAIISPFAGEVTWTRKVYDNTLVLTLTDFDGSNAVTLPLVPVNGAIRMKIANLCSENPLEWDEYLLRTAGMEDSDFKWFYQLLEPPNIKPRTTDLLKRWRQLLKHTLLPAPRLLTQPTQFSGRPPYDCAGAKTTFSFPEFSTWSS